MTLTFSVESLLSVLLLAASGGFVSWCLFDCLNDKAFEREHDVAENPNENFLALVDIAEKANRRAMAATDDKHKMQEERDEARQHVRYLLARINAYGGSRSEIAYHALIELSERIQASLEAADA